MNVKVIIALCCFGMVGVGFSAPTVWVQSVTNGDEVVTMRLTKMALRGDHFELLSQNESGGYDVVEAVAERSYLGSVDGYPGAVSCGVLQDDGRFRGAVYFDRGVTWFTLGSAVVDTRALDYGTFSSFEFPSAPTVSAGQAGTTMYAYDLGVDADHDYFSRAGNSVAKAFEGIEYSVCLVRAIYMRDLLLRPYLSRVIIRTSVANDPYVGLSQGDYLNALRAEWNANQTTTEHDLVVGASPTKIGGGLAWVGVVGSSSGYSVSQSNSSGNFDVVFRHEMGHNWDCGHFVGGSPEGKGIMGGNSPSRFSGCEVYRILNHRTKKVNAGGILDAEGIFSAIELPPYAAMDAVEFVQALSSSLLVDVLANDFDANGQAVTLDTFDSLSANGGTVVQQGGKLVYSAPGAFLGSDYFMYTVADSTGKTATGVVIVNVQPNDALRVYLPLDEITGTVAVDQSLFAHDATVEGTDFSVASDAGKYGTAIRLDGVDDHVKISDVNLNANTVTLTAWVKPSASQNGWAGIIFSRSSSAMGLNVGDAGELRYHWNGSKWGWNSQLVPPADQWTFVALVVEPAKATMYMNTGAGFQSAVNVSTHLAEAFGTTYVGLDPSRSARHFKGAIDEVRMYSQALSQSELQAIYGGGGAESPQPFDGATDVTSARISWSPSAVATAYEVYMGTNQTAVMTATQASPEYQGTVGKPQFLSEVSDQTQYYWRIDTVTATTTLQGTVWEFTTGNIEIVPQTISINFERGSSEAFSGGMGIGPLSLEGTYWNIARYDTGSLTALIDSIGMSVDANVQWKSSTMWSNTDGTSDDEHKLAVGYLDDGNSGSGQGATVTISNIPYTMYRVYGLIASDGSNSGAAMQGLDFNVNGTWVYGGSSARTTTVYGNIDLNYYNHGAYWTEIMPGSVVGNYWTIVSTGTTCTITGRVKSGSSRGSITGVIIEKLQDTDGDGIPNDTDTDDDNDDIPDEWEIAHGLNPLQNDHAADPDADGFDNKFEYGADTDPQDANSKQTFSIRQPSGTAPAIYFRSSAQRLYTIETRESLQEGSWVALFPLVPGTGAEMTTPIPSENPKGYYRLRIELP